MTTHRDAHYVDAVATHLTHLPDHIRRIALDDLRGLLASGVAPDELGPAEAYASNLVIGFDPEPDPTEPQASFGIPFETRGATDPRVRSRLWDPQNPKILVPRLLGGGWMVNLGAVAVKLGLLRPDDWDDEALDRVPAWILQAFRFWPIAYAAAALAAATVAYQSGDKVPTHFSVSGHPDRWGNHNVAWIPPAIAAGVATWGALPTKGDDRMIRPALAIYGSGVAAGIAAITAYSAKNPTRRAPIAAALAIPFAGMVKAIALPVALGVRRSWRQAGHKQA
ncbi:DUF1648 domain-containing protein [Ammonicoccus fulvus]|uniref:DUF1648 domain-containing protein n=1 Tax=Ammonicoccus fulvus TaxID=3138240 RepID=A0ABZ3FM48_9ACTN